MNSKFNEHWKQDFQIFLSSSEVTPPLSLREKIIGMVERDLNPSLQSVFFKVLAVHAVTSLISLSLCSQFGIRALPVLDLMNSVMKIAGESLCMVFCGALYLGFSALVISFMLRIEELRLVQKHKFLQVSFLSGASLGVFLCLGAEVLWGPSLLWLLGSLAGGIGSLKVGSMIRIHLQQLQRQSQIL